MPLAFFFALVSASVAVLTDLRFRRIPNELTYGSAAAAFLFHTVAGSPLGALGGWAIGLLAFLPVYLLRGMGAGDVKLLAAVGAWVGPWMVIWTALYGALAGGVLAVIVTLRQGYFTSMIHNLGSLLATWCVAGIRPVRGVTLRTASGPRLPYAISILSGLVIATWLQ